MSDPTDTENPLILHLSAFATAGPGQPTLLPCPPTAPLISPLLAHLSMASDDDLKCTYWHQPEAYKDKVGEYYIDTVWQRYLSNHTYTRSFQPLEGTERERYQYIIDKAHKEDVARVKEEDTLHRHLSAAAKEIEKLRKGRPLSSQPPVQAQVANPSILIKRKRGRPRKYPRPEDSPDESTQPAPQNEQNEQDRRMTVVPQVSVALQQQASRQYAESAKLVQAGIKQLEEHKKETRRPLRHERQYPGFDEWVIETQFGYVHAKLALLREHWFMGHRPGDPIMRVVDAPQIHPIFGLSDLFRHPVFGSEAFDITQLFFRFRFEGIVPFNYPESQQRLEDHAFPAFMTVIIAALGFNPEKPDAEVPLQLKRVWTILQQDMQDMDVSTKNELVHLMCTLQRIWKIKYGMDSSKLPRFLQVQFEKSKSRLGEMAWLVCKVLSMLPGYHVLRCFTDWFLQAMVGASLQSMANWYFECQLGAEARGQMEDGDIENILFYRVDSPIEKHLPVLFDTYDRHGSYTPFPAGRLEELQALARKFVPQLFVPTLKRRNDPIFRSSVPVTPEELRRILAGRSSKKRPTTTAGNRGDKDGDNEHEKENDSITVATSFDPKKKKSTKARTLPSPPTSSPTKTAGKPTKSASKRQRRPDHDEPSPSTPSKRARH